MAVVRVLGSVPGAQGLDGIVGRPVPPVDRDAVVRVVQSVGQHDVLLVARQERGGTISLELLVDPVLMFEVGKVQGRGGFDDM